MTPIRIAVRPEMFAHLAKTRMTLVANYPDQTTRKGPQYRKALSEWHGAMHTAEDFLSLLVPDVPRLHASGPGWATELVRIADQVLSSHLGVIDDDTVAIVAYVFASHLNTQQELADEPKEAALI